jgi:hypothetical protein
VSKNARCRALEPVFVCVCVCVFFKCRLTYGGEGTRQTGDLPDQHPNPNLYPHPHPPTPHNGKAIPTEDEHVDGGDIEQRSERHDRVRARCAYPRRRRLYVLFLFFIFYYCTYPRRRGLNVVRDRQRQTETDRDR